jgi:hypothetical protein
MKSTATQRVWNKGAPPHVGWWNASNCQADNAWRWWDGKRWGRVTYAFNSGAKAKAQAMRQAPQQDKIEWSDYWPEGARVVRLDITYARRQRVVDLALEISAKNPTWTESRVWSAAKVVWLNEGQRS